MKLALKLLWERQLGSASTVEGYVKVLPAQGSFETLIHWTDQVDGWIVLSVGVYDIHVSVWIKYVALQQSGWGGGDT